MRKYPLNTRQAEDFAQRLIRAMKLGSIHSEVNTDVYNYVETPKVEISENTD